FRSRTWWSAGVAEWPAISRRLQPRKQATRVEPILNVRLLSRRERIEEPMKTGGGETPTSTPTAVDPGCGMRGAPRTAKYAHEHGGTRYVFCAEHCLKRFQADPAKFLEPKQAAPKAHAAESASARTEYTCPMHPEVRQRGPGACPKCGMALEPV